jgi:hypothetical protein
MIIIESNGCLMIYIVAGLFTFYYRSWSGAWNNEGETTLFFEDWRPGRGGLTLEYSQGKYFYRFNRHE